MDVSKLGPQRPAGKSADGGRPPSARTWSVEAAAEARRLDAEHRARIAETARVTEAARHAAAEHRAAAAAARAAEAARRAAEAARRAAEAEAAAAAEARARAAAERHAAELCAALAAEAAARAAAGRHAAELGAALAAEAAARAGAEARATAVENAIYWRATYPLRKFTGSWPPGLRRLFRGGAKLAWWAITLRLPGRLRARRARRNATAPRAPEPERPSPRIARIEGGEVAAPAPPTSAGRTDSENRPIISSRDPRCRARERS